MNLKTLLISSLCVGLVGCASTREPVPLPPKPLLVTKYIYPDCDTPPKRTHIKLRNLYWDWMKDVDGDTVYFLTPKGYEDASYNTSLTILGVDELKAEIAYYLKCIEAPKDE